MLTLTQSKLLHIGRLFEMIRELERQKDELPEFATVSITNVRPTQFDPLGQRGSFKVPYDRAALLQQLNARIAVAHQELKEFGVEMDPTIEPGYADVTCSIADYAKMQGKTEPAPTLRIREPEKYDGRHPNEMDKVRSSLGEAGHVVLTDKQKRLIDEASAKLRDEYGKRGYIKTPERGY